MLNKMVHGRPQLILQLAREVMRDPALTDMQDIQAEYASEALAVLVQKKFGCSRSRAVMIADRFDTVVRYELNARKKTGGQVYE